MSSKMERFTKRARRVLAVSQEYAIQQQQVFITPVHLLLALAQEEGSVSQAALLESGCDAEQLRQAQPKTEPAKTLDYLTPELDDQYKKSLEYAVDEARRMGLQYIGTEHLLLGILRLNHADVTTMLAACDVEPNAVRMATLRTLQDHPLDSKPKRKLQDQPDNPITFEDIFEDVAERISDFFQSLFSGKRKR